MSRSPSPDDFFRSVQNLERRIATLERQSSTHIETKTFIYGPDIDTSTAIPRAVLNVNPEDAAFESKRIYATHCELASGTADIRFTLNGTEFMIHAASTTPSDEIVADYLDQGPVFLPRSTSWLGIEIDSGSGTLLSAGITVVTQR